jgi:hypothetical protein
LDAADVRTIFEPLQENIYRAFDYTTESQIYDALQASVAGPLLDDIYSQIYHSLFIQLVDGAAVSRVERYALLNVAALDTLNDGAGDPGLQVEAEWRVTGVVAHWGHEHRRTHHYRGRYDISATPAGWRIVSGEILTQLRLPPQDPGTNGEADPRSRESADG